MVDMTRVDLSMYYSSTNTYQNQVKLCTLKVQDDVQLAMAKLCLSVKDCPRSHLMIPQLRVWDRKYQPKDHNF